MAFEQAFQLPSQHTLNYWRIIFLELDFYREKGRIQFGGYPDEAARDQFGDQPVETHSLDIPTAVYKAQLPAYDSILPAAATTDRITAPGEIFEGATVINPVTWTHPMSFQGLGVSHWQVKNIRLSWAARSGRFTIAGYKDEAAYLDDKIKNEVKQTSGAYKGYSYSQVEFNQIFDASTVQGTGDALETQAGFNRADAYNYALANDPFFQGATDIVDDTPETSPPTDPLNP